MDDFTVISWQRNTQAYTAAPYAYKKEIKMQLVPGWKTESEGWWEN